MNGDQLRIGMMLLLIIGLAVFLGVHLIPGWPDARQALVAKLGETGYRGAFSATAAIGLVLIILGKAYAEFAPLWDPPAWGRNAALALMLPVMPLLAAANMPGHIRRIVVHPMLLGIFLWALAHLLANGDLASLALFGGFLLFTVYDWISVTRRGKSGNDGPAKLKHDVIAIVAGLILYALLVHFHANLFGMPAII